MPTINKLTAVDSLQGGDNFPIHDTSNGDSRRVSTTTLQTYMQDNLTFPDDPRLFTRTNAAPSATGFTVTVPDNSDNNWVVITPAAAYASGTVKLPAVGNAVEGQEVLFNITQAVTSFTIDANGATAVTGAPATLAANDSVKLKFDSSTSTWYNVAKDTGVVNIVSSTHSAAGPTDNLNVAGLDILFIDSSSNSVTIGGFINGVANQILRVVRLQSTNTVALEHNEGTGNQDILLSSESDETLVNYGGWLLICDGSNWYEIDEKLGVKTFSTAGPTDNVDVAGVGLLLVDSSGNDVTIGAFTGGINGQVLQVARTSGSNEVTLEHNEGTGNQDILLAKSADDLLDTFGGWTLVCNGTSWIEVGKYKGVSTLSLVGPTDDVDANGKDVIFVDTSSNSVTIGGLINGINGQELTIVRTDTSNTLVLEHNEGGGNQDIFLANESDLTLHNYGGVRLVCDGTSWYEVGDRKNYATHSAAGPTDNVDVGGLDVLFLDSSSNSITVGAFINGVAGQTLRVVRQDTSNIITLEHNEATGNQNIFLALEADDNRRNYGGWTLVCDGTSWFEVGQRNNVVKTTTTLGPTDNESVEDINILVCNTTANSITIGGFSGGIAGQILHITRTSNANTLTIEHLEGGGSQDILLQGSTDFVSTTDYGGLVLYCDGSDWFEIARTG